MSPSVARLVVRRLSSRYVVAAGHPYPERLRSRLDAVAERGLPAALATTLAHGALGVDGIWFIRRIELVLSVNAAADTDRIAYAWARQVGRVLLDEIASGDESNVIRFAHRADYLRRFLLTAADGSAWGRWYFRAFEGLRLLPTSAAIRTAICDEPSDATVALLAMSAAEAGAVVRALSPVDARRVLSVLVAETVPCDAPSALVAVGAAFDALTPAVLPTGGAALVLALFLGAHRVDRRAGGAPLERACSALAEWTVQYRSGRGDEVAAALLAGDADELARCVGAVAATRLAPLLEAEPSLIAQLRGAAVPPCTQGEHEQVVRGTPFGGLFLLLPQAAELPWDELCHGWPDADGVSAATVVRWLAMAMALGADRPHASVTDELVRELSGVPASFADGALGDWQRRISSGARARFLERLVAWRVGERSATKNVFLLVRARAPHGLVALLVDAARGVWVHAAPHRNRELGDWMGRGFSRYVRPGTLLLIDPALAAWMEDMEGVECVLLDANASVHHAARAPALPALCERIDLFGADLAALTFPRRLRIGPALQRLLSVAAQGLLRDFAWRLPGFAYSHVQHLRANFLDFGATLEDHSARRVATLDRPPLHLILAMTGATRREYTLPWLDARPFALFPAD